MLIDKYRRVTTKRFCSETCHYKRERLRYGADPEGQRAKVKEPGEHRACRRTTKTRQLPSFRQSRGEPFIRVGARIARLFGAESLIPT